MKIAEKSFWYSNKYISFLPFALKGISQVLLIDNAISGLLIILGIMIYSPFLGSIAFLSSLFGTIIAVILGGNKEDLHKGLFGFNPTLTGTAAMFLVDSPFNWVIALIAALLSSIVFLVLNHSIKNKNIPVLTLPFILTIWLMQLAAYHLNIFHVNPDFIAESRTLFTFHPQDMPNFLLVLIKGISEVFLIDSLWAGLLILMALFWAGWRYGVYTAMGTFAALLTAHFLGINTETIELGLFNFNAILAIISVGLTFDIKQRKFPVIGIIAAMTSVIVTAGVNILVFPLGLSALTLPFILTTWILLFVRNAFLKK